jgi:Leucine-rich repeat (LRR) protein
VHKSTILYTEHHPVINVIAVFLNSVPFQFLLFLLTLTTTLTIRADEQPADTTHYEPVDHICDKCICPTKPDENAELLILDCTTKDLKSLVSGWPDVFGTNHTGREIIYSMSGNQIASLPQLPETNALLIFTCRHCGIQELAAAVFMDVPNIMRVDLSWNRITGDSLRANIFRGRYSAQEYEPIRLQDLDLSHNQISSLPENLFEHAPSLMRLLLNDNPLGSLDLTTTLAMSTAHKMEHLDLSNTGMAVIPDHLFRSMSNLKELLLQDNHLQFVSESLGQLGGSLKYLYLGGNEISKLDDESFLGKLLEFLQIIVTIKR